MDKQNIRLVFWAVIAVLGYLLFNAWQQDHASKVATIAQTKAEQVVNSAAKSNNEIPTAIVGASAAQSHATMVGGSEQKTRSDARIVRVKTDVFNLQIDALGGDIIYLDLPRYPENLQEPKQGYVLLNEDKDLYYIIQTGLINELGPDSSTTGRALYTFENSNIAMGEDESSLEVDLHFNAPSGIKIIKRYIFTRDNYQINVHYLIENHTNVAYVASPFGRIKRREPEKESSGLFGAVRTYTGAAVNTPEKKYQKISFSDMQKQAWHEKVTGGWAAMVEHYFVSAMVPSNEYKNEYQTEDFGDKIFGIRFVSEAKSIAPGEQAVIETKLYAGPEIATQLKKLAPGLELTIDYGFLWFLCQPIFWLLSTMFGVFKNWGVAIIFTTIIIKGLFYKLSASSYKSMGNMRKLQPKIEALKQRHGDDKTQFSQAMMDLYKREKINPLGGCLPIVVQIPVFIALYYVLLECVELRQAPFIWWIQDLSAKDPFYVLPIIMGISMLVQQRLNPTPPDPMQAKVMMFMPIFFTLLFLQFPSGLVLYWVVNNILSILQQWMIVRKIESAQQ